ncbi:hypothetical protein [Legionella beliardensis]|uniref:hypothetical protein n=1 Tax=Legionella beliardensis TaxID=91822 RepID=UPI0013579C45|nr:hypothetical protein [Legionella beliardensis]
MNEQIFVFILTILAIVVIDWRVFERLLFKDKRIADRANNCPEKVSWSLLKYM